MMSYTKEEAIAELAKRGISPSGEPLTQSNSPSALSSFADANVGWIKGLTRGVGQSIGDILASIGNLPAQGIEALSGKRPYNIPHPDLLNKQSAGLGESLGQMFGQRLPKWALEAYLADRVAPFAGNNLFGRIALGGAQGATTGFAANEGSRQKGAEEGLGIGLGEGVFSEFPLRYAQAGKPFQKIEKAINKKGIDGFNLTPEQFEKTKGFLERYSEDEEATKNLLEQVQTGKYSPVFNTQSRLGEIQRALSKGTVDEKVLGKKVGNLRKDINVNTIQANLKNKGAPEYAQKLQMTQDRFRRYHKAKPYVQAAGLGAAALGSLGGTGTLLYKLLTAGKR